MPELGEEKKKQMLLHYFMKSLPKKWSGKINDTLSEIENSKYALKKTWLFMLYID